MKSVPCDCAQCADDAYQFSLTELKEFAEAGDEIQCRKSRKMIDAAGLLRNLFPAPYRRPEIFVSYRQTDESIKLVDQLENVLRDHNIELRRDLNEVSYRDSFRRFMERLGAADAIVLVLSNEYFESENCMFELTRIDAEGRLGGRVYPVVLKGTRMFTAEDRARIVRHWQGRLDDLRKLEADQDLRDIAQYRNRLGEILKTLADMNVIKAGDSFQPIVHQLEKLIAG